MNSKSILLTALALAVAAGVLSTPPRTMGQAAGEDAALSALLNEVGAQQQLVAANQAKIDEKLVLIAENLRIARIFVGRGGGKVGGR